MTKFQYPSPRIIRLGKYQVNRGLPFDIIITHPKKVKLFNMAKPLMFDEGEKFSSVLDMIKSFIGLCRLLVVHFYAIAAGYSVTYKEENESISLEYR